MEPVHNTGEYVSAPSLPASAAIHVLGEPETAIYAFWHSHSMSLVCGERAIQLGHLEAAHMSLPTLIEHVAPEVDLEPAEVHVYFNGAPDSRLSLTFRDGQATWAVWALLHDKRVKALAFGKVSLANRDRLAVKELYRVWDVYADAASKAAQNARRKEAKETTR